MTTTEAAALWWAERISLNEKRGAFHDSLLRHLDSAGLVDLSVQYANESVLQSAVKDVCDGDCPADVGELFPPHTAMRLRDGMIWVKDGEGAEWQVLRW